MNDHCINQSICQELNYLRRENELLRSRLKRTRFVHFAENAMRVLSESRKEFMDNGHKPANWHEKNLYYIGKNYGLTNDEIESILTCSYLVHPWDRD